MPDEIRQKQDRTIEERDDHEIVPGVIASDLDRQFTHTSRNAA